MPNTAPRTSAARTTLLSTMSAAERRAFLQEQLDQSAVFRQICCAHNGVTGPIEPNVIGDPPTDAEYATAAKDAGIPVEEAKRREEAARREALVEVREQVINQREQEIEAAQRRLSLAPDTPAPAATSPTTPAPDTATSRVGMSPLKTAGLAAAGTGTAMAAGAYLAMALLAPEPEPAPLPQPVPITESTGGEVTTDAEVLSLLHSQGLSAPQTPLGENILKAFKVKPELRQEIMEQIEETLRNE